MKQQLISLYTKIRKYASDNPYFFIIIILLLSIAAFLRFYRLEEFITFLGDQGRDVIIMKRLITFEDLPAIGPPSSVGQIFLGPFYYYATAPFLFLFQFNPVGPAFAVALFSIIGIAISFFLIKKETHPIHAFIFLILVVFSGVHINLSRFSWNPNLLPFFSFITLYFGYKAIQKQSFLYAGLFGFFYGLATHLHHLAFLIALPCIAVSIYFFIIRIKKKKDIIRPIYVAGTAFALFLLANIPLILFDIKNRFINIQSYLSLLSGKQTTEETTDWIYRLHETVGNLFFHTLYFHANPWMWYAILAGTLGLFAYFFHTAQKRNLFIYINFLFIPLYLIIFSFVPSFHHPHYYASLYFSLFVVWAYILYEIFMRIKTLPIAGGILGLIIGGYVVLNIMSPYYAYLSQKGNNQISKARRIARSILPRVQHFPYQVVALPSTETASHIRYFLEIEGKRPLAEESAEEAAQIIVLCPNPKARCEPLGSPQWQLAAFDSPHIQEKWTVDEVQLYSIVHD